MRFKKLLIHEVYTVGALESSNFEVRTIIGRKSFAKNHYVKYVNIIGESKIIKWKSFQKWIHRKSVKWLGFYNSKKKIFITLTKLAELMVKPITRSFDYYSMCKNLVIVIPMENQENEVKNERR